MSTGLTYLCLFDSVSGNPQAGTTLYVFNSYQEAYDYGEWFMRIVTTQIVGSYGQTVLIWTTGPNTNGYWYWTGSAVEFYAYD